MTILKLVRTIERRRRADLVTEIGSGWDGNHPVAVVNARASARRAAIADFERFCSASTAPFHQVNLVAGRDGTITVTDHCVLSHDGKHQCDGNRVRYELVAR